MLTEPLPIELFVTTRFEERRISKIIESWPVESRVLVKIIIAHFREMGIYAVTGMTERYIVDTVITLLKNSPNVAEVLHKAEVAEAARKQSRHVQGR